LNPAPIRARDARIVTNDRELDRYRLVARAVARERMVPDMNPYVLLGSGVGTPEAAALAERLAAWHDSMVAHERRLRLARAEKLCDDECPHVEARTLWTEALATLGDRASELRFLQSRGVTPASPEPHHLPAAAGRTDGTSGERRSRPTVRGSSTGSGRSSTSRTEPSQNITAEF
jgi:hypothetical protein